MPVSDDSVYVWATPFVTRGGALALVGRDAPRRRRKSRPRPPTSRPSPPASRPSPAPARGSLRGRPLRLRAPSACANQHSLPVRRGLGKRARRHDSRAAHQIESSHLQEVYQVHMLPSGNASFPGDDVRLGVVTVASRAVPRWPRVRPRPGLRLGKVSAPPEHLRRPDAARRAHAALSVEIVTVASRAVPRWRRERAPEVLGPHGGARARGSDVRGRTGRPGALPALETRRRLAQ